MSYVRIRSISYRCALALIHYHFTYFASTSKISFHFGWLLIILAWLGEHVMNLFFCKIYRLHLFKTSLWWISCLIMQNGSTRISFYQRKSTLAFASLWIVSISIFYQVYSIWIWVAGLIECIICWMVIGWLIKIVVNSIWRSEGF